MGIEETILLMFDRITHESTSDLDRQQTIEGLRRKLRGTLPSEALKQHGSDNEDEVSALRDQLRAVEMKNVELLRSIEEVQPHAINGYYTLEQFMAALQCKLGRTYGWRTDYVNATKDTPGAFTAETTTIQQWQIKRAVPACFVEQIATLRFRKRTGKSGQEWSDQEYTDLEEFYVEDPNQTNKTLARRCSEQFGRAITENAIRGALDRLRKKNRLPSTRPGRSKRA